MRSVSILLAAFGFGAGSFAMTSDAHALGPVGVEVGAKVGVASNPFSSSSAAGISVQAPNPLGFGLGARGGVTILGFYGGLQFMHYFGSSQDIPGGSISLHTNLYGIEAGYGITLLDLVTIRPQLGIGSASFGHSSSLSGASASASDSGTDKSNLYLEPGVTGLIGLGLWYVGADANVLVFPGLDNTKAAFTLHGQVGLQF